MNPTAPAWVVTNSNGARALKLCNGKRTLRRIILYLSLLAGRDVTNKLSDFLNKVAHETKLFQIDIKPGKEWNAHPKPRIVQFILTNKCNLDCIYCYASDRKISTTTLNLKDYQKIIDDVNRINPSVDFTLTGGEPLLVDKSIEIAEYAKKRGNNTHLLTNGLLISPENAERIAKAFDLVRISLDGSNADIHEYHRGKGTFDKTLKSIALLDKHNTNVQIPFTVTKKNISDMKNMVIKFGSRLSFQPFFQAGSGKDKEYLAITGREYYEAMALIDGVNPMSYLCDSLNHAKQEKITKCAIGDSEISISDTGDVYPCHMLHFPEFLAGNIKDQPLETIYYESPVLKACRNLSAENMETCSACDIRFICGGSCRARSYFEKGRIDTADKFCEYEQLAYTDGLFELHEL